MSRSPDATVVGQTQLSPVTGIDPTATVVSSFPFLSAPLTAGALGQFGPYPVVRFLGAGAAGYVFEAFDKELDRAVVLKILRPELAANDDHQRRFVREAKAVAAVHSDYTVPIFAVGEHAGLPYLEMPLLVGETLQARLGRIGLLPPAEGLEVARQTALGLADAHAAGLIHRDIKPANLWIEPDPTGGIRRVRLLDFGLARPPEPKNSVTIRGMVIGTPHYMSPEQAQGDLVDHRSDLFSLGITLYSMLTGRMPFTGTNLTSTLLAMVTKPHVPVGEMNPQVPAEASTLIDRLLAKQPQDRPETAAEVAEQLAAILLEMGVEFHPRGASGVIAIATPRPPVADPHSVSAKSTPTDPPILIRRPLSMPSDPHASSRRPPVFTVEDTPLQVELPPSPAPATNPVRRRVFVWVAVVGVLAALVTTVLVTRWPAAGHIAVAPPAVIPVGVLHSQSGTMKLSEDPVIDATMLAIDEVNAAGGVLGQKVVPIVADGRSDPDVFAAEAEQLLIRSKVVALFGCWTSASRKAVRPVVERNNGLLFYPVQYEGLELSPAVVYLGHAPNQQLLPSVDFLVSERKAKRLFLVGSDYVFPRSANRIIRDHVEANHRGQAEVVGEAYRPLGDENWAKVVADIVEARPDAILNTINGSSNFAFYRELRAKEDQLGRPHTPVLSVSITANELAVMKPADVAGDMLAGTYFDLPDQPNVFRESFRKRFGVERPTTDMMAAAYVGVHLWAAAANKSGSIDPAKVRAAVGGMSFDGPAGTVTIDPDNFHLRQPVRIASVQSDGGLKVVYAADGGRPIKPEPFPSTRTPAQWDRFLKELQIEYGGKWLAPPGR